MPSAKSFLNELRKSVEQHPGVNHLLLNRLATNPFSREDYRIFAENHYALVCSFTGYLERLLLRGPDSESKLWLAKVLIDEYGEGSDGQDHAALYAHFVGACGGSSSQLQGDRVMAPAHKFITMHRRVMEREPFLVGLGAVGPGHEWAIPKMFESLIIGLRRAGFSAEEMQYFTLHVEQDDDHGRWLAEALELYATTPEAQAQILRGTMLSLQARSEFWTGVQRAIVRYRQPRAPRPDGPTPRSVAAEVISSLWDAVPGVLAVEERVRELARSRVPRLRDFK